MLSPCPVGAGARTRAHTTARRRAVQGCRLYQAASRMRESRFIAMDMDGADAPALFSGTRETVWAALPARPAALRRNPAFQDRVFLVVPSLRVRLTA